MNILLVTPFQLQDIGGISVIVKMLYREWTKRGHPVDLLVPGDTLSVRPVKDAPDAPVYAACLRLPYIGQAPLRGFLSFWLHLPLPLYALHHFLTRRRIAAVVIQYPLPWVFYFALLRPFARWKLVAVLQGSDVHQIVALSRVDRLL